MSEGNGTNGRIPLPPRWMWEGVVLVALLGLSVLIWTRTTEDISRAASDIKAESAANVNQSNQLTNHEVRITTIESAHSRMEAKLDRILEKVESR